MPLPAVYAPQIKFAVIQTLGVVQCSNNGHSVMIILTSDDFYAGDTTVHIPVTLLTPHTPFPDILNDILP